MRLTIRIIEIFSSGGLFLGRLFLGALAAVIVVSTLARAIFNHPIIFSDELSSYLLIGVSFLGLAFTLKQKRHIQLELVIERLKPNTRRLLNLIMAAIGFIWAAYFLVGGWYICIYYFQNNTLSNSQLYTPLWIPSIVLVIGVTLLFLQLIAEIFKSSLARYEQKNGLTNKKSISVRDLSMQ